MGYDYTTIQAPLGSLQFEFDSWRYRFHLYNVHSRPIHAIHLLPSYWLCMGCNACSTFHYPDKLYLWKEHGYISWIIQRYYMLTTNHCSCSGWRSINSCRQQANQHACSCWNPAISWSFSRIYNQRNFS